jgi:hypothetical protein
LHLECTFCICAPGVLTPLYLVADFSLIRCSSDSLNLTHYGTYHANPFY